MGEAKADTAIKLPDGVRMSLTVYLTSDKFGIDTKLTLGGMKAVPSAEIMADIVKNTSGIKLLHDHFDDIRVMTDDEVTEYLKSEAEDEEDSDD